MHAFMFCALLSLILLICYKSNTGLYSYVRERLTGVVGWDDDFVAVGAVYITYMKLTIITVLVVNGYYAGRGEQIM